MANPHDVSFEYHGTHFGRPVGLASYTSSQGIGRRSVPFYQRTGYGGGGSGAKAGQWAPYHGFDTQGKSGIKNWFIKPSKGLGEQYDESQGVRYGHPRLKGIGEWLDANPPEFEEKLLDDPIATNQWMRDNNAELMHHWSEQPPPDLTADTVVNGMPMNLAYRMLKARIASPDEEHPEIGRTIFNPDTNEVTDSSVRVMPTKDGRHNNPNNFIRDVIHEDMHTATLPEIDHTNVAQAEYPAFLGEEIYSQRLAEEGKSERPRESYDLERATPHNQALYRISTHPNVPIEDRARAKQAWYDDFVETGEPMNLAWRLLKDYQITPSHDEVMAFMQTIPEQGVEMEGGGDDDCCEKVRQHILEGWKEDEPGNPDDPEDDSFNTPYWLNWLENLSCEDLQDKFAYDEIANYVGCAGFNEADQMKWASEPMDIAHRLLKAPPYHGTTAENAKKIMVEGLKPYYNGNSATIGLPIVSFATDDPKEAYDHAEEYIYDGDVPAVVHIADDVEPVYYGGDWSLYDKTIPPEKLSLEWEAPPHDNEEYDEEYEKMIRELFNEHLKNKGSPMELAYRLLKRQTELGEHHEDFPSSHGPVTGYRAVSNEQRDKMIHEGLAIRPSAKRPWGHGVWAWMGHNEEGLDDAKFNAEHWAEQMNITGRPSSVVGIRGKQDLSYPDNEMHNYDGDYPWYNEDAEWDEDASHGPYALPNDIPPEQTVGVVNRHSSKIHNMLKARQTKLYNWIQDYPGKDPVQQMSAQPSAYKDNYLEGEYPDEFWSFIGDNPEDTESHGASRHRSDEEGNYLAVGVRGKSPIGELPTRGPARNIPDGGGVRVVGKNNMPDPDDIVVMPKNASHMNNFDPKQKGQFRKPRVRISQ